MNGKGSVYVLMVTFSLSAYSVDALPISRCAINFAENPNSESLFQTAATEVTNLDTDLDSRIKIFHSQAQLRRLTQDEVSLLAPVSSSYEHIIREYRQGRYAYRFVVQPSLRSEYIELAKDGFAHRNGREGSKNPAFLLVHTESNDMLFFLEDWAPYGSRDFNDRTVRRVGPLAFEKALLDSLYFREEVSVQTDRINFSGAYRMNTSHFQTGVVQGGLGFSLVDYRGGTEFENLANTAQHQFQGEIDPYLREILRLRSSEQIQIYDDHLRGLGFEFRMSNQGQGAIVTVPRPALMKKRMQALGSGFSHLRFVEDRRAVTKVDLGLTVDYAQIFLFAQNLVEGNVTIFNNFNRSESYIKNAHAFALLPSRAFNWLRETYRVLLELHNIPEQRQESIKKLQMITKFTFELMASYLNQTMSAGLDYHSSYVPFLILIMDRVEPQNIGDFDISQFYRDVDSRIEKSSDHSGRDMKTYTPANIQQILDRGKFSEADVNSIRKFDSQVKARQARIQLFNETAN